MIVPAETREGRPTWPAVLGALVADVVLVLGFVTIGRSAHAPDDDLGAVVAGVPSSGWPFVIGLLVAWVGGQAWRRPLAWWPTGIAVWVVTAGLGLTLRWVVDDGVAVPFVLVASLVLGVSLIGWRVLRVVVLREWAARQAGGAASLADQQQPEQAEPGRDRTPRDG